MWLPWQCLVLSKLSHLYMHNCTLISIHASTCMKKFHETMVIRTRICKVFRKMWLPWQRLVLPKLSHLYAQLHINIIHPCKYEEISLNNKGVIDTRIVKVSRKMWLPWQCLVLPKLSHLYAQLHINIIHPCKYEEMSINNKWGVIRTIIFKCF